MSTWMYLSLPAGAWQLNPQTEPQHNQSDQPRVFHCLLIRSGVG